MTDNKIPLKCPKCKKLIGKIDKYGSCEKIYLYCKSCKKEYEITYKEANKEPKSHA